MCRIFVDASVLFAACYSKVGASRALFQMAARGEVALVISEHVLMEVEKNLRQKAPAAWPTFRELLNLVAAEVVVKPSLQEVKSAAAYTALKDAPIVAAALNAEVDYLVTWDRKHFVNDPKVAQESGLAIVTPDRLVAILRE